jgi:DNA-binding beta-propeller fold protein YncE
MVLAAALVSCTSQSNPEHIEASSPEALVFVSDEAGVVSVIAHGDDGNEVTASFAVGSGGVGDMVLTTEHNLFVNVTANNEVAVFDPDAEAGPELRNYLGSGSRPVHAYLDPEGTRIWVMNDANVTAGDCLTAHPDGGATSSVSLIQNHDNDDGGGAGGEGTIGEVIAEICVGRGHHKAAFSPDKVFVSNISDGSVTVIDNDPDSPTYLEVLTTIDLCDAAKQACDADLATSNFAVPHGIDYSSVSDKIYNGNIGYGTVTVIDPDTYAVETIDIGFANKLHASPDGGFVVVKGADTDSDPDHVIGKLTVIDVEDNSFEQFDLEDVAPDGFEFTPDGAKLYVTSAQDGSGDQLDNLKNDVLLAFDSSDLPNLELLAEIPVGPTEAEHRALAIHEHDGAAEHVFVPAGDGTVTVVDVETDTVVDTIDIGGELGSILIVPMEAADHEEDDDHEH